MTEPNTQETSDDTNEEVERLFGIVKWFDKMKGYGFVQQLNTENDYFVHYSKLKCSNDQCTKHLVAGEYIQFNISEPSVSNTTNDDRPSQVAVKVTGIFNGPLMYENQQSYKTHQQQDNTFRYPRHTSNRNRSQREQVRQRAIEQQTEHVSRRNQYDSLEST